MTIEALKQELKKIRAVLPKIEPQWDIKLSDISPALRLELKQIKVLPEFTSGGLEAVKSVLSSLYWAESLIEDEINQTEGKLPPSPSAPSSPPPQAPNYRAGHPLDFGPFLEEK